MAEYIKRETAIKRVMETKWESGSDGAAAIEIVAATPAADVAPVVHGRWEIVVGSNGKEYMACTCCRVSQDLTGVFTDCPNCGCRMDGGDDE